MGSFSPTDAAFSGFRFVREQPRTILIWAGWYLLFAVLQVGIILLVAGPQFADFMALAQSPTPDEDALLKTMTTLAPLFFLAFLIGMVIFLTLNAAVFRALLRGPEKGRWAGLRFGREELRLLAVYAVSLGVYLAAGSILGMLTAFVSVLTNNLGAAKMLLMPLVWALWIGLMAFLGVRLSLAPVATIAEGKLGLRRSWLLTKTRFWPLLGAFALTLATAAFIYLLVYAVFAALMGAAAIASGGDINQVAQALKRDVTNLPPLVIILEVALTLAQVWLAAAFAVVGASPAVEAYRAFMAEGPAA